jgi:hypothetical protein
MEQGTSDLSGVSSPAPAKLCDCGCGKPAPISKTTDPKRGAVKGQPTRFRVGHSDRTVPRGRKPKLFVEPGQRIGRSIVIDPKAAFSCPSGQPRRAACLRCDCGTEYIRPLAYILRNPDTQSCGDCAGAGDLTGLRFGRLAAVRWLPSGTAARGDGRWLCRCDCGTEVTFFPSQLTIGHAKSCGCGRTGPRKDDAAFTHLFRKYQYGARKRGISWDLAKDDFRRLTSLDCHYCGTAPAAVSRASQLDPGYRYNGIDRMDSNGPYRLGNVVPACRTCNMAKMAVPYGEFMAWIARLASFHFFRPDMTPVQLLKPPA